MQTLIDDGNLEELFLHEGSHISLDRLIEVHYRIIKYPPGRYTSNAILNFHQGTDEWLCARQQDKAFISTYARDNVARLTFNSLAALFSHRISILYKF